MLYACQEIFFNLQTVNADKVMKWQFIGFVEGGISSLLKVLFQYLLERFAKNKI
jgi:hypothetical protein